MTNPLLHKSPLEYELPEYESLAEDHYYPAFQRGVAEQREEVEAIISSSTQPTFENTIVALERSGQTLTRVLNVFFNKTSSDTNPNLDSIEEKIAPELSAHEDWIRLNPALFERITGLYESRASLNLQPEDEWLLELYYKDFRHAGAHLSQAQRDELMLINEELSKLETQFSKRVLDDSNDLAITVDSISDLDGLSPQQIAACKAAAESRGLIGKWVITMVNFTGHPLLASLTNRKLRERIMKASLSKGARGNAHDTREIARTMARLRARRAELFGKRSHAEHVTERQTAKTPENVHEMLRRIAPAALKNARAEGADLQKMIEKSGESFTLESWDWDFYTEKVRKEKYELDTTLLKPYFELEKVLHDGVFYAAEKLFGLTFTERVDLKAYHDDARVFEVHNEDGSKLGLYIADFYARPSKRGGAWMNSLVNQSRLLNQKPVVVNNLNIPKPAAGEVTLLTLAETTTLFHEFGHALHGLLSNVTYPRTSGTSVQRDFVEFPSQVNEMWILWPEVVNNYARHHQTQEPLPQEWIDRIRKSETFNEGHATTSYLAAAILDLAWHEIDSTTEFGEVEEFEAIALRNYGFDYTPVPTRYRTTYFSHIFAGGYSSGYYGYIWSEVLDADAVEWFKENGGLTRANGDHFRNELLSRGGSIDSMQMFRNFRGRDAVIEPLLKRRGLN